VHTLPYVVLRQWRPRDDLCVVCTTVSTYKRVKRHCTATDPKGTSQASNPDILTISHCGAVITRAVSVSLESVRRLPSDPDICCSLHHTRHAFRRHRTRASTMLSHVVLIRLPLHRLFLHVTYCTRPAGILKSAVSEDTRLAASRISFLEQLRCSTSRSRIGMHTT
jgi:hypothetical protein